MTNFQLFLIGSVTAYLLYVNMHNESVIQPKNHIQADITQETKSVKENVPIIADERPKPPKPIAIPVIENPISSLAKIQYHPTQGWINWNLMHSVSQPKFRTMNMRQTF